MTIPTPPGDVPGTGRAKTDTMWQRAYMRVQAVLDQALGTEEEDGSGEGIAADVALLAAQRDQARSEARRATARLRELTEPGLFPLAAGAATSPPPSSRAALVKLIGQHTGLYGYAAEVLADGIEALYGEKSSSDEEGAVQ